MRRVAASGRQLMATAIFVSLAAHALLLATRFVPPPSMRALPFDSRLPIVLVNSRSGTLPLKPDALAQASMDGGGAAEVGRVRSPLPDLGRTAEGRLLDAQRQRVAELEQRQHQLLLMLKHSPLGVPDRSTPLRESGVGTHKAPEAVAAMARGEAEVAREIADYQARPLKRQLTPNTREVPFALYYTALQKKIEQTGTLHFPQSGGAKIYGDLIITIPLRQDGYLYEREGGPRVERSSGNPLLDAAALAIVRRAAPFGRLPAAVGGDGRAQVWEIVARFSFTREQQLLTQPFAESRE